MIYRPNSSRIHASSAASHFKMLSTFQHLIYSKTLPITPCVSRVLFDPNSPVGQAPKALEKVTAFGAKLRRCISSSLGRRRKEKETIMTNYSTPFSV